MRTKKKRVALGIGDMAFVKLWQKSTSAVRVADRLKITPGQASRKAMFMRKHDVPLKTMKRGRTKNWSPLIDLAKSLS